MQTYITDGVCSIKIEFDIENNLIKSVKFTGGCNGNLKAIGRLLEGMKPQNAVDRLAGIQCGTRGTSCSDQLAMALTGWIRENS